MQDQSDNYIRIRGARTHNLKNINVDLPHLQLTVITGVSGSGKSSLAFDTIHSEGQRRFLENLSPGTRQIFSQMQPADVDQISGLPPTISIEQTQRVHSRRSTLATMTELYDYFRLLFAQRGTVHCTQCHQPLHQQSAEQIVDLILALEDRKKVIILSPVITAKKGDHTAVLNKIAKEGFVRARVDGVVVDLSQSQDLKESDFHDIDIVIDRIIVKEGIDARLKESIDLALKHGDGVCIVSQETETCWSDRFLSTRLACGKCQLSFPDPEPRTFSFNSPYGACPNCQGLGVIEASNHEKIEQVCPECQGARINEYGRSVKLKGQSIDQLVDQTAPEILVWLNDWERSELTSHNSQDQEIVDQLLPPIRSRLKYLAEIGLNYIKLNRPAHTLSGGEHQRARLASFLGAETTGACYILDEPTAGLHANETEKLLKILKRLNQAGNTILVVEHDHDVIKASDYILDLGPQAGEQGGEVVVSGCYQDVIQNHRSFTSRALNAEYEIKSRPDTPQSGAKPELVLKGAKLNNLKNVTLKIPLQKLVCITGVSGCGKSSLVLETLVPALKAEFKSESRQDLEYDSLEGSEFLQQIKIIDQAPLGQSGRSNPATYCGIWDEIRKLFAKTKLSRMRGYTARRFSFNAKEGRCKHCHGQGYRRVDMQFLPPLYLPCEKCKTKRFNQQTLAVKYRGKSVSDILDMPVDEAVVFFDQIPKLKKVLQVLKELGLGYLALGQPANMLSGGEAQRIKLATELISNPTAMTLFVLDEPTRGLHAADIDCLLSVLDRLVQEGNSVLMIEHHPQAILAADWMIDLGPEGGESGGIILDEGTPEEISVRKTGQTGQMLNDFISNSTHR
ncbi:UvrABC system protein A [Gimesia alba]|uniref:UvrABC system protein A n=1 Tax=Gimesia alba TaxID=2527973 RepID=A0A517RGD7_9PLAN|nr:ATP-binding cassette domain-containing protein [Gimesia alba]QDT42946.1 UvrABC system protein A [Gimesia alba]